MKKLLFFLFVSFSTWSFSQNNDIHTYQNGTEFCFFYGDKVIYINAIHHCFQDRDTLSDWLFKKRIRQYKKKLRIFRSGKVTASAICKLFSDDKRAEKINYRMIQNNLIEHKEDLAFYLQQQGFTVLNFWQFRENQNSIDIQYFIGVDMNCIFYNFRIIKKRRSVALVKGDSGLIMIWE